MSKIWTRGRVTDKKVGGPPVFVPSERGPPLFSSPNKQRSKEGRWNSANSIDRTLKARAFKSLSENLVQDEPNVARLSIVLDDDEEQPREYAPLTRRNSAPPISPGPPMSPGILKSPLRKARPKKAPRSVKIGGERIKIIPSRAEIEASTKPWDRRGF